MAGTMSMVSGMSSELGVAAKVEQFGVKEFYGQNLNVSAILQMINSKQTQLLLQSYILKQHPCTIVISQVTHVWDDDFVSLC